MIVAKTGAPVVPVRVRGSFEAFSQDRKIPRCAQIEVTAGKAMYFPLTGVPNRGYYDMVSNEVMDSIEAL